MKCKQNFHRRQRNSSANNICFWQFVSLIMMINIHYLATAQRNVLLHVFVPSGGMEKVGLLQKEILSSIHIILVTHPSKWWESPLFPSPMGRMFGCDSENILFAFGPTRTKDKAEARRMHMILGWNQPFSQHWVEFISTDEEDAYMQLIYCNKGICYSSDLNQQWSNQHLNLALFTIRRPQIRPKALSASEMCSGNDKSNTNSACWIPL